jgi:hypothetical protein
MLRLRERLRKLERSPMLQQPLPDPLDPVVGLALRQISDEDLALLKKMVTDRDAGILGPFSVQESAALAAWETALANIQGK